MGLNQSTHGTWNTNAICNLHLATGKICRPGSGPFSLTGQPNAMGGREMGYMGPGLPGQRSTMSADDRAYVEQAWGIAAGTLRPEAGSGTVAMFENMVAGKIKACWIICTNPVASAPNRKKVIAGLEACRAGDHPGRLSRDRDQRLRRHRVAGRALGRGRGSDDQLRTQHDADAQGGGTARGGVAGLGRSSPGSPARWVTGAHSPTSPPPRCSRRSASPGIRRPATTSAAPATRSWRRPRCNGRSPRRPRATAIRSATSMTASASPCALSEDGRRPEIVFATERGKAFFLPGPHMPPAEMPDADFPFVLNTGRLQHQWHTLTKTGKGRHAQQAQSRSLRRAAS